MARVRVTLRRKLQVGAGTQPPKELRAFPLPARVLGCLCALAGATGLLGWLVDIEAIRRVVPSLPEMQPNTALGLAASGLSLALARERDRLAKVLAVLVGAIGLLTSVEYVSAVDLGIDNLVLQGTLRMAPQTALSLFATGGALYARRTTRGAGLVPVLASVPVALAYLSLVGLSFGAEMPVFPLATTMAVHTAVAFLAVGAGLVVSQPDRGRALRWRSAGPGGRMVRALFPACVFLPPVLVWLQRIGEDNGAWDRGFGIALQATMTMLLLGIGLAFHARAADAAEAERTREAERFRRIVEDNPEGVALVDLAGRVLYANEQLTELMGCPLPPGFEIATCVDKQVQGYFREVLQRAGHAPVRAAVATCVVGGMRRFLRFCATPVRDEVPSILLIARDDTSRRLAEDAVRSRTRALELATRDLEAFALLAAHDLREPLRKIQLHTDRIAAMSGPGGDIFDGVARIRDVAAALQQQVSDLLAYSRVPVAARAVERVDLARLVAGAVRSMQPRLDDAGARVSVDPLPILDVDPALFREVFLHLFENALKFRRPQVPLVIAVRARPLSGQQVELSVEDNGIGFDEGDRERIFGAFRTLHPRDRYPGSGVGLALCRRIVELHGGAIEANGRIGEGAVFRIRLPIHATQGIEAVCQPQPEPA